MACYCSTHDFGFECDPAVGPCKQWSVLTGPDQGAADKLRAKLHREKYGYTFDELVVFYSSGELPD